MHACRMPHAQIRLFRFASLKFGHDSMFPVLVLIVCLAGAMPPKITSAATIMPSDSRTMSVGTQTRRNLRFRLLRIWCCRRQRASLLSKALTPDSHHLNCGSPLQQFGESLDLRHNVQSRSYSDSCTEHELCSSILSSV